MQRQMMKLPEEVFVTSAEIVRCLNKQLVDALLVDVSGFAGDGTVKHQYNVHGL